MDGPTIRELRRRLGITQRQLGDRFEVDQGTVSRWERGVERPRPARMAKLRALLLRDEEHRAFERSLAIVRQDILPATLVCDRARLAEISASGARHFRDRGRDPDKLIGMSLDAYAEDAGIPELSRLVRESGLLSGDALLMRFSLNIRGMGHTTVYEPLFQDGRLAGVLNYCTRYFAFPENDESSLERLEVLPADATGAMVTLHRGPREGMIPA